MPEWQARSGAWVLACWVVLLLVLLTTDNPPQPRVWAQPAHFFSSVFLAVAVAGLLVARNLAATASGAGWLTLITMMIVVVMLELLQLFSATRAFEWQDIIDGVAGAAVGAVISACLVRALGASRFFKLSLAQSVAVILVVVGLVAFEASPTPPAPAVVCDVPDRLAVDWSLARIENFRQADDRIDAGNSEFCEFVDGVSTLNHELVLDGGAVVSASLDGLLDALADSGQMSFAIRFKSATTERPKHPGVLAALIRSGKSSQPLARVLWYGKNLSAIIRLNSHEGIGTNITKRVTNRYHEVAVVYDGEQQTTYFDGEVVGYERTVLDPPEPDDTLTLELGWRSDNRWQPFRGVIQSIVISATALTAAEVGELFADLSQR